MYEKKIVNKSIRLAPSTYNYILSFDGDGFNEKLEKMVYRLKQEQSQLDLAVDEKTKKIEDLNEEIKQKEFILTMLKNIQINIQSAFDYAKKIL